MTRKAEAAAGLGTPQRPAAHPDAATSSGYSRPPPISNAESRAPAVRLTACASARQLSALGRLDPDVGNCEATGPAEAQWLRSHDRETLLPRKVRNDEHRCPD
jgi:hypothetical protein